MPNPQKPTTKSTAQPKQKKIVPATEVLSNAQKQALGADLAELLVSSLTDSQNQIQSFVGLTTQLKQKQDELDIMAADSLPAAILTDYTSDVLLPNSNGDLVSIIADNPNCQLVISDIYERLALPLEKIVHVLLKNGICIGEFEQVANVSVAARAAAANESDAALLDVNADNDDFDAKINAALEGIVSKPAKDKKKTADEQVYVRNPGTILPNISIIPDTYTVFPILKYERCIGYLQVKASQTTFSEFDWENQELNYEDVIVHPVTDYCYSTFGVSPSSKPLKLRVKSKDGATVTVYEVAQGHSILEDAYSAWRTMSLLQDSIVLASLIKNAQIMLVECEAGTATKQQIEAGKMKLRQLFEGQLAMGRQGIKSYLNPQSKPAYIYSFVSNGVGKITANLIGGEYNPGQLYYLTPFVNQFFAAMRAPKQQYGFTEGAGGLDGGGAVEQYMQRYKATVQRLKRLLGDFIGHCIDNVLMAKGLTNLVGAYSVKVHGAYDEVRNQETQELTSKLALYQSVIDFTKIEDHEKQRALRSVMLKEVITSPQIIKLIDEMFAKEAAPAPTPTDEGDITTLSDTQLSEDVASDLGVGGSEEPIDIEIPVEGEEAPAEAPAEELPEMSETLTEE